MMINGVVAVAQRREVTPLDCFFKRRFQTFCVCQEIECFDVLWFLLESRFREPLGLTRKIAKLRHDLRIDFVVAA
jgi:hypothetical protein